MEVNTFFAATLLESKVKQHIETIRKTTKKADAKTAYKVVYELLCFGRDTDIINSVCFDILINEAKDALQLAL